MNQEQAFEALDKIIEKSRVHFYKPIQIAEILYRDRTLKDIDLAKLETYRNKSKKWRDAICINFLGRTSTSSAKYQDDLFSDTAVPPEALLVLGEINRSKNGEIEAYIYRKFSEKYNQISSGLDYSIKHKKETFNLEEFLSLFWHEPGLRRSIDKIYEIIVFSLFSAIIDALDMYIEVSINKDKLKILDEFHDFAERVIQLSKENTKIKLKAKINRVGVTNAADRGLDMWANFGMAIQIKHLSLTEEIAENIVSSINTDRIVIVCKDSEEKILVSLLSQLGWRSKIQSIITETDLKNWYERALRGKFSDIIGDKVISNINQEIVLEFPSTDKSEFNVFLKYRGYI